MISINSMEFSNILSYGDSNEVHFNKSAVTQLIGSNGAGKSSIPIILEEGLFNKNSKGIKKGDLLNKFSTKPTYNIKICFTVDVDQYVIDKTVGSTTKVTLHKNDEDISGHTTTQTYKSMEEIFGVDFMTFTKIVYQSMVSSLDFISATDSTRKKFLISLLGLEKYVAKELILKDNLKANKTLLIGAESSVNTINSIIKSQGTIPTVVEVPELEDINTEALYTLQATKKAELADIKTRNKAIESNNKAKAELDALDLVVEPISTKLTHISREEIQYQGHGRISAALHSELYKLELAKDTCPTCKQPVDISDTLQRIADIEAELVSNSIEEKKLKDYIKIATTHNSLIDKYETYTKELAVLRGRYDPTVSAEYLIADTLVAEIKVVTAEIADLNSKMQDSIDLRDAAIRTNNLVEIKQAQLKDNQSKLKIESTKLMESSVLCARLETLVASMGSKGLIAYKIESLVKVFEELINEYLQVLSDGEFTLKFVMDETKLQINLRSDSVDMDIKSISSGEFNKVNTATLLAVRKMLTSISKIDINLLFLDEVVAVLDPESKDTLINLLLSEENLNTIVVSHGYTHPLASRLNVIKENKISRLELDE